MVKEFFITRIYNKRRLLNQKVKETITEDKNFFVLNLNKYNASLLVVTLAFTCRYLYYGKVEEVNFEDYFVDQDFGEIFYQLRILLFLLNENCKKSFKDYEEFKILNNFLK